jgi:hypothetical protein
MRRRITLAGAMLSAVALIAVAAVPASARVPGGQGLESFGSADCGPLGTDVEVFGPSPVQATSGYMLIDDETHLHVVAARFELTVNGQVVFEQDFGAKAGLTTVTCTQTFDVEEGTATFTLTAAVVPPR